MEFFCWFFCSSRCCPKKKGEYAQLRAQKKKAWILCIAEGKSLLSCWVAGWACWLLACWLCWLQGCWLCWLGFAGLSFQQPVCCYCFIFLFLLLFHGKLLGALCPLYSRWHVSSFRASIRWYVLKG